MIKNIWNDLYIGITDNLEKRLIYHNTKQGALFTKRGREFSIVFYEKYKTMTKARQREIQLKKWSRNKKEVLIERFQNGLETEM